MSPPHCLLVPLLARSILTLKQFMKFFVTLPSMAESTLGNVIPPLHTEVIIVALGELIHQSLLVIQPSDIERGLHCNTLSFSASLLNTALMRIAHHYPHAHGTLLGWFNAKHQLEMLQFQTEHYPLHAHSAPIYQQPVYSAAQYLQPGRQSSVFQSRSQFYAPHPNMPLCSPMPVHINFHLPYQAAVSGLNPSMPLLPHLPEKRAIHSGPFSPATHMCAPVDMVPEPCQPSQKKRVRLKECNMEDQKCPIPCPQSFLPHSDTSHPHIPDLHYTNVNQEVVQKIIQLENDPHRFQTVKRRIKAMDNVMGSTGPMESVDGTGIEDTSEGHHPMVADVGAIGTDRHRHKTSVRKAKAISNQSKIDEFSLRANGDNQLFKCIAVHITELNKKPFHRDCTGLFGNRTVDEIRESNFGWLLNPFIAYAVLMKSNALKLFYPLPTPYDTTKGGKLRTLNLLSLKNALKQILTEYTVPLEEIVHHPVTHTLPFSSSLTGAISDLLQNLFNDVYQDICKYQEDIIEYIQSSRAPPPNPKPSLSKGKRQNTR